MRNDVEHQEKLSMKTEQSNLRTEETRSPLVLLGPNQEKEIVAKENVQSRNHVTIPDANRYLHKTYTRLRQIDETLGPGAQPKREIGAVALDGNEKAYEYNGCEMRCMRTTADPIAFSTAFRGTGRTAGAGAGARGPGFRGRRGWSSSSPA